MYAIVAAASKMAGEGDRQQGAASRPRVPQQPPGADRRQRNRSRRGEPAIRQLDPVREVGERAQQEQVVGAVGPAVGVEEGVPEEGPAEGGECGLQVDSKHHGTHHRSPQVAARVGEGQVEQQREGEPGGEHGQAPDQRRSLVPADPQRREPDQASEHGQIADPLCRPAGGD